MPLQVRRAPPVPRHALLCCCCQRPLWSAGAAFPEARFCHLLTDHEKLPLKASCQAVVKSRLAEMRNQAYRAWIQIMIGPTLDQVQACIWLAGQLGASSGAAPETQGNAICSAAGSAWGDSRWSKGESVMEAGCGSEPLEEEPLFIERAHPKCFHYEQQYDERKTRCV